MIKTKKICSIILVLILIICIWPIHSISAATLSAKAKEKYENIISSRSFVNDMNTAFEMASMQKQEGDGASYFFDDVNNDGKKELVISYHPYSGTDWTLVYYYSNKTKKCSYQKIYGEISKIGKGAIVVFSNPYSLYGHDEVSQIYKSKGNKIVNTGYSKVSGYDEDWKMHTNYYIDLYKSSEKRISKAQFLKQYKKYKFRKPAKSSMVGDKY